MPGSQLRHAIRGLNLVVPGAGLVLLGEPGVGVLLGLLFGGLLNVLIASTLIFPDELSTLTTAVAAIGAAAVYVFAQRRLPRAATRATLALLAAQRRSALRHAADCIERGRAADALAALAPLAALRAHDLLVAYRYAQAVSLTEDAGAAREAWRCLRRIDLHKVYGDEIASHLAAAKDRP
ncbi:hypothetical protein RAS1_33470 [Phycisphaerae bacterium RAS1]|nr:hypothetical protein RAS1_33470 [Phycisphaerae bacterium RAS1]